MEVYNHVFVLPTTIWVSRQPFSFSIAHQSIQGEFMCQFRRTDENNILRQTEIRLNIHRGR